MTPLLDPRSDARTLIVMRHAEADLPWGTSDFDRPLTAAGREQAPAAGHWLVEQGVVPEMILCSAALRTRQTCTWVCDALGDKAPTASLDERLYNCAPSELLRAVNRTPATVRSLLVIAHYPGVQELVMRLAAPDSDYDAAVEASSGFSPAATAVLSFRGEWDELDGADARLLAYAEH